MSESATVQRKPAGALLTAGETAAMLALDKDHSAPAEAIRYLCRTRQIRFCTVSGRLRFKPEWIAEYVEKQTVEPAK